MEAAQRIDIGQTLRRTEQPGAGLALFAMTSEQIACTDWRRLYELQFRTLGDPRKAQKVTITPAWLLGVAQRANSRHLELSIEHPPGTVHLERNIMRELSESAGIVAEWMQRQAIREAIHAGPFGPALPARGDFVRVRRESVVRCGQQEHVSQKAQRVRVHFADRGYVDPSEIDACGRRVVRQSKITWPGTGGLWRQTDANNIEVGA